jgi:chemotaxis protein CheD
MRQVRNGPVRDHDGSSPTQAVHIHIGEHYISDQPGLEILTVLGSCIGACIRDPKRGVGGMNHFMLPGRSAESAPGAVNEMRYGQYAMERLINDLLAAGAKRERLEIKLFGGANTFQTGMRIGDRNVAFVRQFLADEGMCIAAEDLGGTVGRRLRFNPVSGTVMRLRMERGLGTHLFRKEIDFSQTVDTTSMDGSVELFV